MAHTDLSEVAGVVFIDVRAMVVLNGEFERGISHWTPVDEY